MVAVVVSIDDACKAVKDPRTADVPVAARLANMAAAVVPALELQLLPVVVIMTWLTSQQPSSLLQDCRIWHLRFACQQLYHDDKHKTYQVRKVFEREILQATINPPMEAAA